jgi:hypothetical protein
MSAEEYRRHAANCLAMLAELPADQAAQSHLLEMARAWYNLANQAERNSKLDLVYEVPPAPQPQPQPQPMQQQQSKAKDE